MPYILSTINRKTEKKLSEYVRIRGDIKDKLDRLKEDPRRTNGAHPLHGKLQGKWSCWLGSNIRSIYIIDDNKKEVIIQAVGTHKFTNT